MNAGKSSPTHRDKPKATWITAESPAATKRAEVAAIKMIEEDEATDKVKEVYAEIKDTFEIDFVPNMYKLMAPNPA